MPPTYMSRKPNVSHKPDGCITSFINMVITLGCSAGGCLATLFMISPAIILGLIILAIFL